MSTSFSPRRGDLVAYKGTLYYFQPNGAMCYLYHYRSDVGKSQMAAQSVPRHQIRAPTPTEVAMKVKVIEPLESPPDPMALLIEKFSHQSM